MMNRYSVSFYVYVRLFCIFFFTVLTSVSGCFWICQKENIRQFLFDGCNTSWVLAVNNICQFLWQMKRLLLGNLAVGDDVHGNLVIQKTDDIEIDTVKAACNLDDIFLAHFFAAGILDNRNLAVQFAEIQILVDFHAHTGRNMV